MYDRGREDLLAAPHSQARNATTKLTQMMVAFLLCRFTTVLGNLHQNKEVNKEVDRVCGKDKKPFVPEFEPGFSVGRPHHLE